MKKSNTWLKTLGAAAAGISLACYYQAFKLEQQIDNLAPQVNDLAKDIANTEKNVKELEQLAILVSSLELHETSWEDTSTPPDQQGIDIFDDYFGKESLKTMRIEQDSLKMDLVDGGTIPRDWKGQTKSATMTYNMAARKNSFAVVHMDGREKISNHDFSEFTGYYHQIMQIKACDTASKESAKDFLKNYCPAP